MGDKLKEAFLRAPAHMPASVAGEFRAFLSPQNLEIMGGTLVVCGVSHLFGVGEAVDAFLLAVGVATIGGSVVDIGYKLNMFVDRACHARNENDLNRAAQALADAIVELGVTILMAVLLHRSIKELRRVPSLRINTIRLQPRGLLKVGADSQADVFWRKPTVTPVGGDPNLPAGRGSTSPFGDVEYSTDGSATDQ